MRPACLVQGEAWQNAALKLPCQGRCQQCPAAAQGSQPRLPGLSLLLGTLQGQPGMALWEFPTPCPAGSSAPRELMGVSEL